jgi:hypothetical protein
MNVLLPDGDLDAPDGDERDPFDPAGPLAAAQAMLERMGLPLPPLPEPLLRLLEQVGETVFTTWVGKSSLAHRAALVTRAAHGDAVPGIGLSHEGYGANSWSLRCFLVVPRAALFIDIPFGGAYMDLDASRTEVAEAWASAGRLLQAALASSVDGMVVVDHRGVRGSRWCVAGPEPQWRDARNAIDDAAAALEAAPAAPG